ncbi:MAG: diguanylate cyclase [Rubrobacter sp.]|nr:diguanylate cyclase [Rubrobacter sp.]
MSSDLEDTVDVAERICQAVKRECSPERDASLSRQITVSLGLATLTEGTQRLDLLIGAAHREMYRPKRAGKIGYPQWVFPELWVGPGLSRLSSASLTKADPSRRTFAGRGKRSL